MQINYEVTIDEFPLKKIKSLYKKLILETENKLQITQEYCASVIFVDSKAIQQINKEFRNLNQPTDVISFAVLDSTTIDLPEIEMELGDIFINTEYAQKQAEEYGHSLEREYGFLFVHGLLHLLGYDHLNKEEEIEMFRLQDEILDGIISRKA